jgi:hypothetical protein
MVNKVSDEIANNIKNYLDENVTKSKQRVMQIHEGEEEQTYHESTEKQ